MAWSISISPEGWDDIRKALEAWARDDLMEAVATAQVEAEHDQEAFEERLQCRGVDWRALANEIAGHGPGSTIYVYPDGTVSLDPHAVSGE